MQNISALFVDEGGGCDSAEVALFVVEGGVGQNLGFYRTLGVFKSWKRRVGSC